jgi:hypothetical protein
MADRIEALPSASKNLDLADEFVPFVDLSKSRGSAVLLARAAVEALV